MRKEPVLIASLDGDMTKLLRLMLHRHSKQRDILDIAADADVRGERFHRHLLPVMRPAELIEAV
jgi:hypothetical protein